MVTVRESPQAKISPDKTSAQWPPKSPFHALLSSPSGRRKWQERQSHVGERSPSPSPIKRPMSSSKALQALAGADDDDDDGGDPEGEEDLEQEERQAQLELARIEAQLKLERIRQRRKAASGEGEGRAQSRAETLTTSPRKALKPSVSRQELRRAEVEVPLSPVRERYVPAEQMSPARKRLGLSAAAKAQDVSLKRARDGTQIQRSSSGRSTAVQDAPQPRSFNDRLRATRQHEVEREERYERVERTKSKGFGVNGSSDVRRREDAGSRATIRSGTNAQRPSSAGRAHTGKARNEPAVGRSASVRSTQSTSQQRPKANGLFQGIDRNARSANNTTDSDSDLDITPTASDPLPSSSSYDPFSELHLTKRHIPHVDVARAMEGEEESENEIYTLPRLLKEVKAPDYDPPDCIDWVLFAIIASKSSPYDQKQHNRTSDVNKPQEDAEAPRNKFMVLKLTDLHWEIDCFLFGTAFDQFWKLTPGTLLAILNPAIMPPKGNQHSGRFSLKLGSSEDCVMEIGIARDLGYCGSVKKDGQQCGQWVDKRKADICAFHLEMLVEKQRKGRMEVNTMWRGHGDDPTKSRGRGGEGQGKRQGGPKNHREYGTLYSVNTGMGKSAASLLDAEDQNKLEGWAEDEASRKRIAEKENERKLQRTLQSLSAGDESVGAACLRSRTTTSTTTTSRTLDARQEKAMLFEKPKAADLGLLGNKAGAAHLSPAKDRKRHFGLGAATSVSRNEGIGWGGARNARLLQPKEKEGRFGSPERGQTTLQGGTARGGVATKGGGTRPSAIRARSEDGSLSPSKKRARFMLAEKGLREPGRESGGPELGLAGGDDEDDDLDVV